MVVIALKATKFGGGFNVAINNRDSSSKIQRSRKKENGKDATEWKTENRMKPKLVLES